MLDDCLYFNAAALARRLEREWAQAFAPFALTPSQAFMVRVVLAQPGLLQSELAEALKITRPTATRVLDGLVAKGLLQRRATAHDGREVAIHPTPAALAIKAALRQAGDAATSQMKQLLGEAPYGEAVDHLRALRIALT